MNDKKWMTEKEKELLDLIIEVIRSHDPTERCDFNEEHITTSEAKISNTLWYIKEEFLMITQYLEEGIEYLH